MKLDYIKAIAKYLDYDLELRKKENNENDLYDEYYNSLKELTFKLKSYYENNDKKLNENEYKELDDLFKDAFKKSDDYIKSPHDLDGFEIDNVRKEMAKTIHKDFLAEAYVDFQNIDINSDKSFNEMMDEFRNVKIKVDNDLEKEAGGLSTRNKISLDLDGKKINGYFTEEIKFEEKELENKIFKEINLRYPKYKDFFDLVRKDGMLEPFYFVAYQKENICNDEYGIADDYINNVAFGVYPEKYQDEFARLFNKYNNSLEFSYACADLGKKLDSLRLYKHVNDNSLGLKKGEIINNRNDATSGIAHLLNRDTLVAKSRPVVVERVINGKVTSIKGTFMEEAIGKDLRKLDPKDFVRTTNINDWDTLDAKKSLADLQILDYICGNVDRHSQNMLYDFDPKTHKLKGVQGIDNDASFIKNKVELNGKIGQFTCLNQLKVIDEEMALKVLALDDASFKATLLGYGLDNKAIDAAWERTNVLKEAIKANLVYEPGKTNINESIGKDIPMIHIVKHDDWEKISLNELGDRANNIFEVVSTAQNNLNEIQENKSLIDDCGIALGALKCKIDDGEEFLLRARENKPLFGTSNRYINFIKALQLYNSSRDLDEKLKALKDLRVNVDIYKKDKIRDGVLDENDNLLKILSGKDLNRVNLVKEVDVFIDETLKLAEEKDLLFEKRKNDVKKVDEVNAIFRKGKYQNYPKAYLNEEGKIYVNKDIINRDDASFKELYDFQKINPNNKYVLKSVVNLKNQLDIDYHHGRIPKEYYDYRIENLNNKNFDCDAKEKFEPCNPDSKYLENEFQNQIKNQIDNEINNNNMKNINNDIIEEKLMEDDSFEIIDNGGK